MPTTFLDARATAAVRRVLDLCATRSPGTGTVFDILEDLHGLIGCDWVSFNWFDTARRRVYHSQVVASGERRLGDPEVLAAEDEDDPFWHWYWRCAPCSLPDRVGTPVVVSISEFYTPREWSQHPMCATLGGVSDELLVSYPQAPGRTLRVLFGRDERARFGDRERFLMALLLPHLGPPLARTLGSPPGTGPVLTERQREVLRLVGLGMVNKQIAQALEISTGTVRKHLENAYDRLGVQSRTAAVREAALDDAPPTSRLTEANHRNDGRPIDRARSREQPGASPGLDCARGLAHPDRVIFQRGVTPATTGGTHASGVAEGFSPHALEGICVR